MYTDIEQRIKLVADFYIRNKSNVRDTARYAGVSKSTVHKDLFERLPQINLELYKEVAKIRDVNIAERYHRGGIALRSKFKNLKGDTLCPRY